MTEKKKQKETKNQKVSRRNFLKTAAVAGAAASSIGFPCRCHRGYVRDV